MDSYSVFKQANSLVRQCGTRDPLRIAKEIGIKIYYEDAFTDLLRMYTFRWNHRMMFLNPKMDTRLRQMVAAHEIGHDCRHRDLAKGGALQEFVLFNMKDTTEYGRQMPLPPIFFWTAIRCIHWHGKAMMSYSFLRCWDRTSISC